MIKKVIKTPEQKCSICRALFFENSKFSLGRLLLIVVFLTMITMWWCDSISAFVYFKPTPFVTENITNIFLALLGYAGLTKFKKPLSEKLSQTKEE